jgi:hypothetical protein
VQRLKGKKAQGLANLRNKISYKEHAQLNTTGAGAKIRKKIKKPNKSQKRIKTVGGDHT